MDWSLTVIPFTDFWEIEGTAGVSSTGSEVRSAYSSGADVDVAEIKKQLEEFYKK